MLRVLAPADYRVQPWKNGGGTTTEIHIHPEGAGWDAFGWRVGIADVAQSGPFSSFPGIDRSIMLLECPEGSGMTLDVDGTRTELPVHAFFDFRGEATTVGHLHGRPVRDFNVMSRRAQWRHRCGVVRLAMGARFALADGAWQFVHVAAGGVTLDVEGTPRQVPAGQSILADAGQAIAVTAGAAETMLVRAAFDPVTSGRHS